MNTTKTIENNNTKINYDELYHNSIAINTLLKKSISTYYWSLNFDDIIYDDIQNELDENTRYNWNRWFIHIDWYDDLIELKNIWIDFDYIDNTLKIFLEFFKDKINDRIPNLKEIFSKYWIYWIEYDYRSPTYYNYSDDELSFKYYYDDKKIDKELIPYIKNYIDNIMVKSYDWYCSFEKTNIDEIDKSEYSFIYAILDKENLIDSFKYAIDDSIELTYDCYYENFTSYFHYNSKEYIMDCNDEYWYYLKEKTN